MLSVPVRVAPLLPIVPAFTVAAMTVPDAVNEDPVYTAPALPIVAAFTVLAITVPLEVKLATVVSPLADNVVNAPVLGVALPIGVLLMLTKV